MSDEKRIQIRHKIETWMLGATLLSGASALIYQTLWMRAFSVLFGSTTQAASVLLASFMAGLALGGAVIARLRVKRVLRSYALVESGIALLALLSLPLLGWIPASSTLPKALMAALAVIPAAALAGATVPLLVESLSRQGLSFQGGFGSLYKFNTLGAALGVFASTFWLVENLGMQGSMLAAAGGNIAAAWLAWRKRASEVLAIEIPPAVTRSTRLPFPPFLAMAALGCGLSAFVLEVLWSRSISLVLGSSIYSFNVMLLALLLGLALGTWIYEKLRERLADPKSVLSRAFFFLGLAILAQVALIGRLPAIWMALIHLLPAGFKAYQAMGFTLCLMALGGVTTLQGFIFPLLAHLGDPQAAGSQSLAGRLYAWNTLGAIAGALAAGFILVPNFGLQAPFVLAAGIPFALAAWAMPKNRLAALALVLALIVPFAKYYRPWDPMAMSSGVYLYGLRDPDALRQGESYAQYLRRSDELLWYSEGREAVVSVRKSGQVTSLQVNGKTDASDGDMVTQKLVAHLPLALHGHAKTALIIGWGSGCSTGTALLYPLEKADCVEIEPDTLKAAEWFKSMNRGSLRDPRLTMHDGDGRNFLLKNQGRYDVILSEPSNPWIKGIASLFTLESYIAARERLAKGGLFCQWFHYYNMGPDDLKTQFRTFCAAFPEASLWVVPAPEGLQALSGDILLLGSNEAQKVEMAGLEAVYNDKKIQEDLAGIGIKSPLSFIVGRVTGREALLKLAGEGRVNSDNWPSLEFSSPRFLYFGKKALDRLNRENYAMIEGAEEEALGVGAGAESLREAGRLCVDRQLMRRAESLLRRSLALNARSARAWLDLGRVQAHRGDPEAPESMRRAIRLDGAMRDARVFLAKFFLSSGRFDEGLAEYREMARRWPKDDEAWLGQGFALMKKGDLGEAKRMFQRCLALNPGHPLALSVMKKLEARN